MTCRDEVLAAAYNIVKAKGENLFTVDEVVDYLAKKGTRCKTSTIETYVRSRCCANAKRNHATVYNDFLRVGEGLYKMINNPLEYSGE